MIKFSRKAGSYGGPWLAIETVFRGRGGGGEVVGGMWVLLLIWAALRSGALPRALSLPGLVVALARDAAQRCTPRDV